MAIRAYGLSTTNHPAWSSKKTYNLLSFVIPTVPNGFSYEVVVGGVSGTNQPVWPTVIGQSVQDGDPLQTNPVTWTCRALIAPNPLVVVADAHAAGGYPQKDIWVRSARPFASGKDTFFVYGSFDGENWRQIDEMEAPQNANKSDRHKGFDNAYPYTKVSVASAYACEIEIVAGE